MFYATDRNEHGLSHDPFKAIVSPRPIGWIGSRSSDGQDNLAPYSFFNAVSTMPKIIMFSSDGIKDSVRNIAETGVFTASMVSRDLAEKMNNTSAPLDHGTSEFEAAGLKSISGRLVDAPFVGEAYAVLECRMTAIMEPPALEGASSESRMVFGQVVAIHIKDEALTSEGLLDMARVRPLARLGYLDYCDGGDVFEMARPG
nr:flavin reductase family protein [Marinicella sp. W31]MDC2876650.1 flavin reductase family protein [Marinicella sp. W31]